MADGRSDQSWQNGLCEPLKRGLKGRGADPMGDISLVDRCPVCDCVLESIEIPCPDCRACPRCGGLHDH